MSELPTKRVDRYVYYDTVEVIDESGEKTGEMSGIFAGILLYPNIDTLKKQDGEVEGDWYRLAAGWDYVNMRPEPRTGTPLLGKYTGDEPVKMLNSMIDVYGNEWGWFVVDSRNVWIAIQYKGDVFMEKIDARS